MIVIVGTFSPSLKTSVVKKDEKLKDLSFPLKTSLFP